MSELTDFAQIERTQQAFENFSKMRPEEQKDAAWSTLFLTIGIVAPPLLYLVAALGFGDAIQSQFGINMGDPIFSAIFAFLILPWIGLVFLVTPYRAVGIGVLIVFEYACCWATNPLLALLPTAFQCIYLYHKAKYILACNCTDQVNANFCFYYHQKPTETDEGIVKGIFSYTYNKKAYRESTIFEYRSLSDDELTKCEKIHPLEEGQETVLRINPHFPNKIDWVDSPLASKPNLYKEQITENLKKYKKPLLIILGISAVLYLVITLANGFLIATTLFALENLALLLLTEVLCYIAISLAFVSD